MPNFTILLPPAEGKIEGGNPFAPDMFDYRTSNTFNYFHDLNAERRGIIDALHRVLDDPETDLEALFGLDREAALEAVRIDKAIYRAPLMSALDRYSPGVLYKAMDFGGLPTGAQRRLLEQGIIFSGIFGLLRPDDLIPNYRLRMDATVPGIGRVSQYWRPHLSRALNTAVRDRFVWNLLPTALEEAWDNQVTYATMVRVRFLRFSEGELRPVTHGVKPLRGRLVNFLVRETLEELDPLLSWRHPDGYVVDQDACTYDETTRTHEIVMVRH